MTGILTTSGKKLHFNNVQQKFLFFDTDSYMWILFILHICYILNYIFSFIPYFVYTYTLYIVPYTYTLYLYLIHCTLDKKLVGELLVEVEF